MRAQALRHIGLAALLALATTGCAEMGPTSALMTDSFTAGTSRNGLVGSSPLGGGGVSGSVGGDRQPAVGGATTALYQTAIGPIAWKGVQLARMLGSGTSLLWNAPPDRYGQAIAIPQEGLGWAVGYGVARYQAGAWDTENTDVDAVSNPTTTSSQRILLTDVAFAPGSSTVGYAVGTRGTILRYDATAKRWVKVTVPDATGMHLGTVKVLAANDVWVAGQVLLHFDGATWTKVTSVPGEISGLAVVDAGNVWASTGSGLYQWDGAAWTARFTPTGRTVGAPQVAAFGSTVVGLALEPGVPNGAVFTYQNGAWQTETVTVPADVGLDTVVLASQTTAYAKTYDNAGVYRFDLGTKKWSYYSD